MLSLALLWAVPNAARADQEIPVKGMVTMLELGADYCMPCRMMKPIVAEAKKEYQGRAAFVFVDVQENRLAAMAYGLRAIPTQIFFDKQGKEAWRHEGYLSRENIDLVLAKLGVEKPKAATK
ncbi:thioredoxin family protein [Desulfoferula mesophila]|uniref:thioredoxin family protein n=1 Tax=Desulfoferula mesophila TaxID=3058419 RepID=UPI0033130351